MKFVVTRLDTCGFRVVAGNGRTFDNWFDAHRFADGISFKEYAKVEQVEGPFWHKFNPWRDRVIYVTPEELALCLEGIGELVVYPDGKSDLNTPERYVKEWKKAYDKLDPYILPDSSLLGSHSIGLRYGPEAHEYISPMGNRNRVNALLYKKRGGR